MTMRLPRFVVAKPLRGGRTGFYWYVTRYYRDLGCIIPNEPLGADYTAACGADGKGGKAAILNAQFDEWRAASDGEPITGIARFGTVDWLFREYKTSNGYLERVSIRTRPDYERIMLLVGDMPTKKGDRVGDRPVKSITPLAADKLYEKVIAGPRGLRLRQGEKVIMLCRRAWKVVHRLYPDQFDEAVPNPWLGVTKRRRVMATKKAATREQVYAFAAAAMEAGHPEAAGAAVICFEWLQRPENVLAGYVRWSDYRARDAEDAIRIEHHKTGAVVLHPLQEIIEGEPVLFYADAEAVLAQVPRRGVPLILKPKRDGTAEPYTAMVMAKVVRKIRELAGLPSWFTLDSCRHGGMTELEEAELTDGQGRALSAHRSKAYEKYAKRTFDRALAATRKRHAHRVASVTGEQNGKEFRNEARFSFRNDEPGEQNGIA
jgi:integrase